MVQVAKLTADLFANTSKFEAGMKRARKSGVKFGKVMAKASKVAAAAIATVGVALVALTLKQAAVIDETAKLSKALGVNIREFQALALVASEAGISQDQVGTIITKSQRSILEAARGLETYRRSFDTLNLSALELLKLSPEKQFEAIAKALVNVDNATIRTATALEIFGRSGRSVNNILDGFVENLEAARVFNDKFGISLTEIDATKVEEANDTFARVRKTIGGLGNIIAIELAPIITGISNDFLESGFSAQTFASAVKRGMALAAKSIDAVRVVTLGLKAIFREVLVAVNLLLLDATKGLFDFVETLRKVPFLTKQFEGVQENLLKANIQAQKAAERHLDALVDLTKQGNKFVSTSSKIAAFQVEAARRAVDRVKLNKVAVDQQVSLNQLIEEQEEKTKKVSDAEKKRIDNAKELGLTFTSAFEKAIKGGEKFGDLFKALLVDVQAIIARRIITEPLNELISGAISSIGGSSSGGGFLSGIFGGGFGNIFGGGESVGDSAAAFEATLPEFGVGTNSVPRDMTARLHRNEMVIPAFDASKLRNGGGDSGGNVSVVINNNAGSEVSVTQQDTGDGTQLNIMIDQAVAENMNKPGSRTNQALKSFQNQALIRR